MIKESNLHHVHKLSLDQHKVHNFAYESALHKLRRSTQSTSSIKFEENLDVVFPEEINNTLEETFSN